MSYDYANMSVDSRSAHLLMSEMPESKLAMGGSTEQGNPKRMETAMAGSSTVGNPAMEDKLDVFVIGARKGANKTGNSSKRKNGLAKKNNAKKQERGEKRAKARKNGNGKSKMAMIPPITSPLVNPMPNGVFTFTGYKPCPSGTDAPVKTPWGNPPATPPASVPENSGNRIPQRPSGGAHEIYEDEKQADGFFPPIKTAEYTVIAAFLLGVAITIATKNPMEGQALANAMLGITTLNEGQIDEMQNPYLTGDAI